MGSLHRYFYHAVCRPLKLAYERNAGEFEATDVTSPCMLFSEITDHPRGILEDQNGNSYADIKAARSRDSRDSGVHGKKDSPGTGQVPLMPQSSKESVYSLFLL